MLGTMKKTIHHVRTGYSKVALYKDLKRHSELFKSSTGYEKSDKDVYA